MPCSLSTVAEDENHDFRSKDTIVKSSSSRFTVSTLDENLYDLPKRKSDYITIVIPQLNLKSILYGDNKNSPIINTKDIKKSVSLIEDSYESFNDVKIVTLPKTVPNFYNISKETIMNEKNKITQKNFISYCKLCF